MADDDEDPEEQSSDCDLAIPPELKKKCLAAADPENLYTLKINTYQVCQLNTILAKMALRLEPKESVLTARRRREHEEQQKLMKIPTVSRKLAM